MANAQIAEIALIDEKQNYMKFTHKCYLDEGSGGALEENEVQHPGDEAEGEVGGEEREEPGRGVERGVGLQLVQVAIQARPRLRQQPRHGVEADLEAGHVGVKLPPQPHGEHERLEQGEGGLLLGVHQQQPHAEGQALAVAHLRVQDAVRLQQVKQAALARTQGAAEIAVTGKCAA